MDKSYTLAIQHILHSLLARLSIPYCNPEYDQAMHDACVLGAQARNIPLTGPVHIGNYFFVGVPIAANAYAHLPDYSTRVYIGLYTANLVAVEDACGNQIGLLKSFCHNFFKRIPHGHTIMDSYDLILRELPNHFDVVVADMMLQSNLDFVVANVLEYEMQHRLISLSARGFPVFLRNLSGAAKIYSLFAFPREIPLRSYVEIIPPSMTYVNYVNDIFSFYKEELVNESVNCISNIARCTGTSKLDVLRRLANESFDAHKEVLAVLSRTDPLALDAYKAFVQGYVYFHTSSKRYKLAYLWKLAEEEAKAKSSLTRNKSASFFTLLIVLLMTSITLFVQLIRHWRPYTL